MFTGIIEATGTVQTLQRTAADAQAGADGAAGAHLVITTTLDVAPLPLGASIAVDGVCLTVVRRGPGWFAADLGPETLACTTLGALAAGDRVHLERPLRLGDPLGGHLVSGHVDAVGTIVARRPIGQALELELSAPPAVARTLVVKGSITVDGASLTVNAVDGARFSVTLIPHTLAVTTLGDKPAGARVNLEGDLIAKHIDRLVGAQLAARGQAAASDVAPAPSPRAPLSLETLRKHGYAR
jgi:riboflavin synthase